MRETTKRWLLAAVLLTVSVTAVVIAMNAPEAAYVPPDDETPVWIMLGGATLHLPLLCYCLCLGWCAAWLGWEFIRRELRPQRITFLLLLGMGVMLSLIKPAITAYGWDEEAHRIHAYIFSGHDGYGAADYMSAFNTWFFGYIPYSVGIGLGTVLRLGDGWTLRMGFICGAVCYAALCALAVKHTPKYKLTMMTIAALPTCMMIAASVSYDGMVIACLMLGTALLMEELAHPQKLLTGNRAVAMVSVMTLGTLPKPAYSFILLTLWMLPQTKFSSRRRCAAFKLFVLVIFLLCMASMLLGMYDDILPGDDRMDDTDSAGQIAYILHNPAAFLAMVGQYLVTVFIGLFRDAPVMWNAIFQDKTASLVLWAVLLFLCPLCVAGEDASSSLLTPRRRIALGIWSLVPLFALMMAQYVVSTPVAKATIDGMQPRYVLQVLAPLSLAVMLPEKLRGKCRPAQRWIMLAVTSLLFYLTFQSGYDYILSGIYGL